MKYKDGSESTIRKQHIPQRKKEKQEVEYRTFSPFVNGRQISVNKYLEKYPELKEHEDCAKLNSIELMWCWYYGSKDSPFFKKYFDKKDRAFHVTNYLFKQEDVFIEPTTKKELLDGKISHLWHKVINFFMGLNTDIRLSAKNMVEAMYDQYRDIMENGLKYFTDADGIVDFTKYTTTTVKIKSELPSIIKTIEEGFGVTRTVSGADSDELAIYENWIKNKR